MWSNVFINSQNIIKTTDRAALIKMPSSSVYSGWTFWHPAKLVREEGGNGYFMSLSFTDNWEFRLFKSYKQGQNPQKTVSPDEIIEAFKGSDEVIRGQAKESSDSYLNVTEPEPIDKEVEVDESLKR